MVSLRSLFFGEIDSRMSILFRTDLADAVSDVGEMPARYDDDDDDDDDDEARVDVVAASAVAVADVDAADLSSALDFVSCITEAGGNDIADDVSISSSSAADNKMSAAEADVPGISCCECNAFNTLSAIDDGLSTFGGS